jgi:hypothetical protein
MTPAALKAYPEQWAMASFGDEGAAIGELLTRYSQYAARRKPELVDPSSFSLADFETFTTDWHKLVADMQVEKAKLPKEAQDAYFEIVEHPILALSDLYDLYYAVAMNRMLAAKNDPNANLFADKAEAAFKRDQDLSNAYHKIAGGKWDGMMLQTHIGYTTWQEPKSNIMPEVKRVSGQAAGNITPPTSAAFNGVSIEATDYSRAMNGKGLTWTTIAHLGRTKGSVLALPQGAPPTTEADNIHLEYDVTLAKGEEVPVQLYMAPTIDTKAAGGIKIGVSLDDGPMQTLAYNLIPTPGRAGSLDQAAWIKAVENNVHILSAKLPKVGAGKHTLKIWRLSDNAVLEKLVIGERVQAQSYLGP